MKIQKINTFDINNHGFTLVELIVVITILAILGTISFISLSGYSSQARDSLRISDISSINSSLELFHVDSGKYPLPDSYETVSYGGDILWNQGIFGKTVYGNVGKLDKRPMDPLTDKEYIYSVTGDKNSFQILNLLEGDLVINNNINLLDNTNAGNNVRIPKISGFYNGLYVKTQNYIVPTPSIITSEDIVGGLVLNNINIKSQVITGGENVPNVGNVVTSTGGLNINLSVYTGSIDKSSTDEQKINSMLAIQGAYTGSELASEGVYKTILSKTTSEQLLTIANTFILNLTTGTIEPILSCNGNNYLFKQDIISDITNLIGCSFGGGVIAGLTNSNNDILIITPSRCTNSTTPVCSGGTDNVVYTWNNGNYDGIVTTGILSTTDGTGNSSYLGSLDSDSVIAGNQPHVAAKYCEDMNYSSQIDWYLPSKDELNTIYLGKASGKLTGFDTYFYWSSTESSIINRAWSQNFIDGVQYDDSGKFNALYVRCTRKY